MGLPEFLARCRGRAVVAHTAGFDLAIIKRAARRAGLTPVESPVLDIDLLAHALFPSWWDLVLQAAAFCLLLPAPTGYGANSLFVLNTPHCSSPIGMP